MWLCIADWESWFAGQELMVGGSDEPVEAVTNGYELAIPADESSGSKGKVLGSREFARFYRQRPRLDDTRQSVAVNKVLARYDLHHIMTAGGVEHFSFCAKSQWCQPQQRALASDVIRIWRQFFADLLLSVSNVCSCAGQTNVCMFAQEQHDSLVEPHMNFSRLLALTFAKHKRWT